MYMYMLSITLTVKLDFPWLAPPSEPVNPMSLSNLHLTEETSHDLYSQITNRIEFLWYPEPFLFPELPSL